MPQANQWLAFPFNSYFSCNCAINHYVFSINPHPKRKNANEESAIFNDEPSCNTVFMPLNNKIYVIFYECQ